MERAQHGDTDTSFCSVVIYPCLMGALTCALAATVHTRWCWIYALWHRQYPDSNDLPTSLLDHSAYS